MAVLVAYAGNKNNEKLYTPELRQMAYQQYCAHIAMGKSKSSWYFKHPDITLSSHNMEGYLKRYSHEFDPDIMQVSLAMGYAKWEQIVEDSAEGKNKDANTASLQMIMRNKFAWDKPEHRVNLDAEANIIEMHDKVLKQIRIYQEERSIPKEIEHDTGRSEDDSHEN